MDETGILEENEIYVPLRIEGGAKLVQGDLVVTRSPALHPGDVKVARAVDVPKDSPLRDLYNCIVFSSKGTRDIPSQLSGGDLDGDVYQIFWRTAIFPKILATPADYPIVTPIDIGREVTRSDMTDFFIKFMEQDQLGRIANNHQTLADQREEGTFDADCLTLATLHSTAVDFSKTGIAVNAPLNPRTTHARENPSNSPLLSGTNPRSTIYIGKPKFNPSLFQRKTRLHGLRPPRPHPGRYLPPLPVPLRHGR